MLLSQEMIFDSFGESKWVEIFKVIRDSLPKIYSLVSMRSFVCQHLFSFEFYAILFGRILSECYDDLRCQHTGIMVALSLLLISEVYFMH